MPANSQAGDATPTDKPFLFEVVRHMYRWYLDEKHAAAVVNKDEIVFWVSEPKPVLDKDDKSRFGKIVIPQLNIEVAVKKADYHIPELDVTVKSDGYKITRTGTVQSKPSAPEWKKVTASYEEMTTYLFANRKLASFPDEQLVLRMRLAAHNAVVADLEAKGLTLPKTEQTLHLSPISPVANEAWIFWEEGKYLVHFSSDMDLTNEGLWKHNELAVKVYDIAEKTVVTLDEVAGSNAYMTRDEVGRALFNCLIQGRRLKITPMDDKQRDDQRKKINK